MAQTAGWLLAYSHDFSVYVPLLMVGQAEYQRPVLAGEEVEIEVRLESIQFHAASARAAIRNADQQEMAQGYLMFGIESMDGRETRGESIIPAWKRTGEGRLWLARTWKKLSGEDLPLSAHYPGAAE